MTSAPGLHIEWLAQGCRMLAGGRMNLSAAARTVNEQNPKPPVGWELHPTDGRSREPRQGPPRRAATASLNKPATPRPALQGAKDAAGLAACRGAGLTENVKEPKVKNSQAW